MSGAAIFGLASTGGMQEDGEGVLQPTGTLAARIVRELSERIVTGELGPGTRLDEMLLADRFQTSRTPIREALRELAAIGLVDSQPRRSACVAQISTRGLLEKFELMAELEAACAGFAADRMSEAEKTELAEVHAGANTLVARDDRAAYRAHNTAFHGRLYQGARNTALRDSTLAVRKTVTAFRSVQFDLEERLSRSQEEHGALLEAVQNSDAVAARSLMQSHILSVMEAVERYLHEKIPHPI